MRSIIVAFLLCLGAVAFATENGPQTAPVEAQTSCQWTEAFSGRFYMNPPSAWIDEFKAEAARTGKDQKPLKFEEAHWWVYIETIDGHQSTCAKKPKDRTSEYPACVKDRVGKTDLLTSTRTQILKVLVKDLLLPERKGRSSAFPPELYDTGLFWRMVNKNLELKGLQDAALCRMKIVVHGKYRKNSQPATLEWWKKTEVILPEGMGECKAGDPPVCGQ